MSKSATVFINHLANAYVGIYTTLGGSKSTMADLAWCRRANEHTQRANKKTIMPNDVFDALEDIEFPFLRERLEAEFKSMLSLPPSQSRFCYPNM